MDPTYSIARQQLDNRWHRLQGSEPMADLRRERSLPNPRLRLRNAAHARAGTPPDSPRSPRSPASSESGSPHRRRRMSEPAQSAYDDVQDERRRRSQQSKILSGSTFSDDDKIRRARRRKLLFCGGLAWLFAVLVIYLIYLRSTARNSRPPAR